MSLQIKGSDFGASYLGVYKWYGYKNLTKVAFINLLTLTKFQAFVTFGLGFMHKRTTRSRIMMMEHLVEVGLRDVFTTNDTENESL